MKTNHHSIYPVNTLARVSAFLAIAALSLAAAFGKDAGNNSMGRAFSSPEDAVKALGAAANSRDVNALADIFGPGFADLRSSDPVEGRREVAAFTGRFNESNDLNQVADNRYILETGDDHWPFPIPLVSTNGVWFFDTQAGAQEVLNRRIGYNELEALKALRAGDQAQREYAAEDHNGDGVLEFAQKIVSTPGKKDGLYWSPDIDGEISPLGPLFAEAQSEGYVKNTDTNAAPQPFHGYFFKILTRQGKDAPAGAYNYIINGHMLAGFGFVAWPSRYGESGFMTFIINQQGKVYQKDLGPDTTEKASAIKEYNPGPGWDISPD